MERMGYCGLSCGECPVYLATRSGDEALRSQLAREYATETFHPAPEELTCSGCRSDAPCAVMCGECPMRLCAMGRELENCGRCADYPCGVVEELVPADAAQRLRLTEIHRAAMKNTVQQ